MNLSARCIAKHVLFVWALLCGSLISTLVGAEPTASQFAAAVVRVDSIIESQARSRSSLGLERTGSAVVIDASGLLVTAGYLVLEAKSVLVTFANGSSAMANIVINDHATGLALLRVALPDDVIAISLGNSDLLGVDDSVVVLWHGGTDNAHVARIASVREFAGAAEYLLDNAFYTAPATRSFSGAALLNRDAELVGVGSLLLSDIGVAGASASGNMFIPVQLLRANLGLLLSGRPSVAEHPWLGITLNDSKPDLTVTRVAQDSPAAAAGLLSGDQLIAINSNRVRTNGGFYRKLWSASAGDTVELLISRERVIQKIKVLTATRGSWLK